MNKEPLITVGAIGTIVAAFLVFLDEFGIDISDSQQTAINNLVAVLAPIVVVFIARQFVFSPNTTQALVDRAAVTKNTDIGTPPDGGVKA